MLRWTFLLGVIGSLTACRLPEKAATTDASSADPSAVQACVDYTQFAAFTGDAVMQQRWNDAGQSVDAMGASCNELATEDPQQFAAIVQKKADVDQFLAAAEANQATPAPPAVAPSNCHPSYEGACVPIAEDVDCLPGEGNGPAYQQGTVRVVGDDVYELDSDGDGLGCEPRPGD